jgi:hypothetical protein
LPSSTVERFGPIAVSGQIPVWLFVVDPGHLRALSQKEIAESIDLAEFNDADAATFGTLEDREHMVGLRMRLMQTAIVPERRLKIPSEAFDICGEFLDRSHIWLDQSPSHLDIYTTTYVQKLLAKPPAEFLPVVFPAK